MCSKLPAQGQIFAKVEGPGTHRLESGVKSLLHCPARRPQNLELSWLWKKPFQLLEEDRACQSSVLDDLCQVHNVLLPDALSCVPEDDKSDARQLLPGRAIEHAARLGCGQRHSDVLLPVCPDQNVIRWKLCALLEDGIGLPRRRLHMPCVRLRNLDLKSKLVTYLCFQQAQIHRSSLKLASLRAVPLPMLVDEQVQLLGCFQGRLVVLGLHGLEIVRQIFHKGCPSISYEPLQAGLKSGPPQLAMITHISLPRGRFGPSMAVGHEDVVPLRPLEVLHVPTAQPHAEQRACQNTLMAALLC